MADFTIVPIIMPTVDISQLSKLHSEYLGQSLNKVFDSNFVTKDSLGAMVYAATLSKSSYNEVLRNNKQSNALDILTFAFVMQADIEVSEAVVDISELTIVRKHITRVQDLLIVSASIRGWLSVHSRYHDSSNPILADFADRTSNILKSAGLKELWVYL
jgi:hypothetical protein